VASRVLTKFPKIWTGDLVFEPTWPVFELGYILEIAKTNILIKFDQNRVANVVTRVLTSNVDERRSTDNGQPLTAIAHHISWAEKVLLHHHNGRGPMLFYDSKAIFSQYLLFAALALHVIYFKGIIIIEIGPTHAKVK